MRSFAAVVSALVAACLPSASLAQSRLDHPTGLDFPYFVDTGELDGIPTGPLPVVDEILHVPNAAWVRVFFTQVSLDDGSYVRMTSLLDNEVQELDAAGLAMWGNSSAYFNGDSVRLELIAGQNAQGDRLVIEHLSVALSIEEPGTRGGSGECGICSADDRVASSEDWSGRLMPVGCSASIFTSNSCMVSAGHCISGQLVAQFRVPASQNDCDTVNPPVADQFPVTATQQINNGVGNDWSVLRIGTNGAGQRPFQRYGQLRRISPVVANVGNPVEIFGFGVDQTCTRSQTQQRSSGAVTARTASSYQYNADVRGGNSGSGLLNSGRIIGIVTHCLENCPNFGTRVDVASFASARNALCPACVADIDGNGAIDLTDLATFLANFGFCHPEADFAPEADLNSDNCVDIEDLTLLLSAFGTNCP